MMEARKNNAMEFINSEEEKTAEILGMIEKAKEEFR